jgi:hypothetical protein
MTDKGKLIDINVDFSNLEGLSQGVKIFTKRISDEIGAFTKPIHVRRLAEANADAAVIEAKNKIELTDIQSRGLQRLVSEEGKRQENIEAIANKAVPHLTDDSKADKIDSSWLGNFFEKRRLASDEEMQSMFAGLLAQEANEPDSIAKRTINHLAQMDKRDAELFQKFCKFVWQFGYLTPIVLEVNKGQYADYGINFNTLNHLESIGLIKFDGLAGFMRQNLPKRISMSYYGRILLLELPNDQNDIVFGHAMLTDVGIQLAPYCQSTASQIHYESIVEDFFKRGYAMSSLTTGKGNHFNP